MDEVKDLIQQIESINDEHLIKINSMAARNIFKEFIKEVPILGQILAARDTYNNTYEAENLKIAIDKINKYINELDKKQKIDHDYLLRMQKELYFIYKSFLNSILFQADDEYLDYLSKYVTNCLNVDFSEERMKLSILNKITKYTSLHFSILKDIYKDKLPSSIQQIRLLAYDSNYEYCISELLNDGFIKSKSPSLTKYAHTSAGAFLLKMLELDKS
jgi:hypothetical protein